MFRGIYTAPPTAGEGLQFVYIPDKQVIRVEGWHNGGRMQAVDMPLGEFMRDLGITAQDCQAAFSGATMAPQVVGQPAQTGMRAASETQNPPVATPSTAPPRT